MERGAKSSSNAITLYGNENASSHLGVLFFVFPLNLIHYSISKKQNFISRQIRGNVLSHSHDFKEKETYTFALILRNKELSWITVKIQKSVKYTKDREEYYMLRYYESLLKRTYKKEKNDLCIKKWNEHMKWKDNYQLE